MRLRPYDSKRDYEYVEKWVDSERIHALWCANLIPCPMTREALDAFLERDAREWGGQAYMAIEENEMPIGFFCYSVNASDDSGFLKCIVLNPELRGRGYGAAMIRLALRFAFDITQVRSVQLNVFHVNEAAIGCYKKAGLVPGAATEAALRYGDEQWTRINMAISRDDI